MEGRKHEATSTITPGGTQTTFVEVWQWGQNSNASMPASPHVLSARPRRLALAYLKGIVSTTERKNGWQLAEHAGESRPDGISAC